MTFRTLFSLLLLVSPLVPKYKALPYKPLPIESYPSRTTSEGLTVAIDPMFTDALAAKAFDRKGILATGIMPLAVIIFNSNGYAVEIEGYSIELLLKEDRIRQVSPEQAFLRIFQGIGLPPQEVRVPSPVPFPRTTIYKSSNAPAWEDFNEKYLGNKRIGPNSLEAGFIYLPVKTYPKLREDLAEARIYIPHLYRADTGNRMMFLEIDLKPALNAAPAK